MMSRIPARLRTPVIFLAGAVVIIAVAVAVDGWVSVLYLGPFALVVAAGYYIWAGRDTDTAAMLRGQADERQAYLRLKTQALVGRVMSMAVAIAYLIAFAVKATLWPFFVLVLLPALTILAGRVIYREHGDSRENGMNVKHF